MFIIVPKRGTIASRKDPSPAPQDAASSHLRMTNGSVRTQNACESCRLRKAKCSGTQPCTRCAAKKEICVYGTNHKQELPVTAQSIAMLQLQQRRLIVALKQMAVVIAEHEGDSSRTADSFDASDLIERYAPATATITAHNRLEIQRKRHSSGTDLVDENKRQKLPGDESAAEADLPPHYQSWRLNEPSAAASTDNMDAAMQYMQILWQNAAPSSTRPPNSMVDERDMAAQFMITTADTAPASSRGIDSSMLDFVNMVDWDVSMDNLLNSMSVDISQ